MIHNGDLRKAIKIIIENSHASSLIDLNINKNFKASLIYPTYDLYLTKQQYDNFWEFLDIIGEGECYLTQFDNCEGGIDSKENTFLRIHKDMTYEEYININLFSVSVLVSKNGKWAIFIEETLEDGIGLFVADEKYIDIFKRRYQNDDLAQYQKDVSRVPNFIYDPYYIKLMKLLKNE